MSTNRTLRTPLTVGMLAVTAAFGLSACVPTEEPAVEETEATQPAERLRPGLERGSLGGRR